MMLRHLQMMCRSQERPIGEEQGILMFDQRAEKDSQRPLSGMYSRMQAQPPPLVPKQSGRENEEVRRQRSPVPGQAPTPSTTRSKLSAQI